MLTCRPHRWARTSRRSVVGTAAAALLLGGCARAAPPPDRVAAAQATPATDSAATERRAGSGAWERCVEARAFAERELALARSGAAGEWVGGAARDSLRRAARGAQVVVEVVLDTLGAPDVGTMRVVRSEGQVFEALARRELTRMRWEPYEPTPGCAARHVVVIPFRLLAGK